MEFEKYLEEFSNTIDLKGFLINITVATLLAFALRFFYIHYGNAISNRRRFASNFLPLALTTMLIITIVKSSIALSLGLVGALSIVRFRAAIKDPEELTYLFLVIGIGLATGASQPILALLAIFIILGLLLLNRLVSGQKMFKQEDRLYVNISTDVIDVQEISKILMGVFPYVELKRMDSSATNLNLSYICKAESVDQISNAREALFALSQATTLSVIDQPDLII